AVAPPCEGAALGAVVEAAHAGILRPILVGPADRIRRVAKDLDLDVDEYEIEDAPHSDASAARAVELVRQGRAEVLMKGSLHTDELMSAVVKKDTGLRTSRRVSHAFVLDVPTYHKVLTVTDAAVNIFPTLDDKRDIVQNAIDFMRAVGVERPKVAILSAVETVTSKIPSTIDAAALCKMADRGQIEGGVLDGPLAFDNAISAEAARTPHESGHEHAAGRQCRLVEPQVLCVLHRRGVRADARRPWPDRRHRHAAAASRPRRRRRDAGGSDVRRRRGRGRRRRPGPRGRLAPPEIRPEQPGRRRPPGGARGPPLLRAGARGRHRADGARALRSARPTPPAPPPAADADAGRAISGGRAGGLLRHRLSPRAPGGCGSVCPP